MRNSKVTAVGAAIALAGSLAALLATYASFPPRVEPAVPRAIGRALAQEALKLLGPGKRLTVFTRDTTAFKQPAADLALAAFTDEVRQGGATITSLQTLQVDPLRPLQVPAGDFFELLRRGHAGDVIVSFLGPPLLTEEQRAALNDVKIKVVAFCPGNLPAYIDLRLLAEQKLLQAAVLARPLSAKGGAPGAPESFDALYVRADAAALAKLPAP